MNSNYKRMICNDVLKVSLVLIGYEKSYVEVFVGGHFCTYDKHHTPPPPRYTTTSGVCFN